MRCVVSPEIGRPRSRFFVKFTVGLMVAAAVSAAATGLLGTSGPSTAGVIPTASIDTSSSTIGFADSELYFMSEAEINRTLDEMQALGVQNVRIMIPWAGIQPTKTTYEWQYIDRIVNAATARNMGILGMVNSTPAWAAKNGIKYSGQPSSSTAFGNFVDQVARRYKGKISAYEIWNEQNSYKFFTPVSASAYTSLLKAAYTRIKAVDPSALVIVGGLSSNLTYGSLTLAPDDFLRKMYAAGAGKYFDAVAYHPYHYKMMFSTGGWHPDSPINQLTRLRQLMVSKGDGHKLIWATEYGQASTFVSEENQAAFLRDMLTTWRTLGYAGPAFVYTTRDSIFIDPAELNAHFGVLNTDWTEKLAAQVIRELTGAGMSEAAAYSLVASQEFRDFLDSGPVIALDDPPSPAETMVGLARSVITTGLRSLNAIVASVATLNPLAIAATTLSAAQTMVGATLAAVPAFAATSWFGSNSTDNRLPLAFASEGRAFTEETSGDLAGLDTNDEEEELSSNEEEGDGLATDGLESGDTDTGDLEAVNDSENLSEEGNEGDGTDITGDIGDELEATMGEDEEAAGQTGVVGTVPGAQPDNLDAENESEDTDDSSDDDNSDG